MPSQSTDEVLLEFRGEKIAFNWERSEKVLWRIRQLLPGPCQIFVNMLIVVYRSDHHQNLCPEIY